VRRDRRGDLEGGAHVVVEPRTRRQFSWYRTPRTWSWRFTLGVVRGAVGAEVVGDAREFFDVGSRIRAWNRARGGICVDAALRIGAELSLILASSVLSFST